jgi:hypothetical protein
MKQIVFFIMLVFPETVLGQVTLEDVVRDTHKHGKFIIFKIEYLNKFHDVILRNSELFFDYKHYLNLDNENYADEMLKHIEKEKPFTIDKKAWRIFRKHLVKQDSKVDSISSKGKEYFIDFYFTTLPSRGSTKYMKIELGQLYNWGYIRKKLFDWGVYVETNGYTGLLTIAEVDWRREIEKRRLQRNKSDSL